MSVLERFEQQAVYFPDSIAVRLKGKSFTYRQLDEQANRVAHALQEAGVGPETLVGVLLDRSAEMLSSLLGIWKAGGAYLPLDPSLPSQRLSFMLEDCEVQYLVTQDSLLGSMPEHQAQVIKVEDVLSQPCAEEKHGLELCPENRLAYVIYTSGSSGKPKGVEICHGGLDNVIQALSDELNLTSRDVVLAMTTTAFDISNLEFFLPLSNGASTYIVERECARDGALLMEAMKDSAATVMLGTPTLWNLLLEAGWQGNPDLQIISGGEILPLTLGRTLARMSRAVWNHYGPTETTICASTEKIEANAEKITIGYPLANVRFHVLDSTMQPVLLGDTGEIYISGAGVGRGYIKRADLNKACFLADPFSSLPGAKLYKTGDLGRELPDGRFEFLGRADEQVKIRGFRIELKEIEEAIRECEGVHAVSVQAIEVAPGDQRLVAYVQSENVEAGSIKEFLRMKLPPYMVPSEYVPIETLPMTTNGKVDRAVLKALRPVLANESKEIQQPRDEMEAGLKHIWEKLLKISPLSVTDNFFELGGHSFLAAKLFSEIEKKLGKKIPLSMLIENPTIESLANCIREQERKHEWPGVITIHAEGKRPPLFVAHGLGGSLLIFRALAEKLGADQPIYGLQMAPGMVDHKERLSIPELASIYVKQIKQISPSGPYHVAGHSLGGLIAFEIASQLAAQGEELGQLALFDCDLHSPSSATSGEATRSILDNIKTAFRRSASMMQRASEAKRSELIQRKIYYETLRLKILLLKHFPAAGRWFPNVFDEEVYVALSTQQYNPQAYAGDAVVFLAADQPRANRKFGTGWAQFILGNFELLKIPGTHQTIFTPPHVEVLAEELMRRLQLFDEGRVQGKRPALTGS